MHLHRSIVIITLVSLVLVISSAGSLHRSSAATRPVMYLTFDDGPDATYTPQILNLLDRYNAKATFFVLGKLIGEQPAIFDRIVRSGHAVGNHSWAHEDLRGRTDEQIKSSLTQTNAVAQKYGYRLRCLRPPYGSTDARVRAAVASVGLSTVLWDIDTLDWQRPGADMLVARVGDHPVGKTILMHDGGGPRSQTVAALSAILSKFADTYDFAPLPGCVQVDSSEASVVPAAISTMSATSAGLLFQPTTPTRILDTRSTGARLTAGDVRRITYHAVGALAVNLTAVNASTDGFLTAWDCVGDAPSTSSNNVQRSGTRAAGTVVALDATGSFCVMSSTATDLVVDVTGEYRTDQGDGFHPTDPQRLLDTRSTGGAAARVPIGIPLDVKMRAVAVNVTVTEPDAAGFVSVFACSAETTNTSAVNFRAGETIANMVQVPLDGSGLCVRSDQRTQIIVDLDGWYGEGGSVLRLGRPVRTLDTRDGSGGWLHTVAADQVINVATPTGGPVGATALLSTITTTDARGQGFVQAWPCSVARPTTSVLNTESGVAVPNTAIISADATGTTCLSSSGRTHLLFDVVGWFEPRS